MNVRSLLTKIAFGISLAALIFSILTLVRAIVFGSGVLMACLLVVGTAIVVAICAIMLFVLRGYTDEADEDEAQPEENEREPAPAVRSSVRYAERREPSEPAEVSSTEGVTTESEPEKVAEAPAARSVEDEVDEIISRLERENSYDLSNFE